MVNYDESFIQGCWRLKDWGMSTAELLNFIEQLLDLGIETFDHAAIYGDYSCESLFGEAVAKNPQLRKQIKLTSKCGIKLPSAKFPQHTHIYDTSYQHIIDSVNRSLTNLHTDYLDLLLIHRPDILMDPDEVARAFYELKNAGKVLSFGVSNFLPSQFELLQSRLNFSLVTNQIEVSVAHNEHFINGNIDYLYKLKLRPQVWSPLAGGSLLQEKSAMFDALEELADKYGCEPSQIAISWLLHHPIKFQILLGSGNLQRIKNLLASQKILLSKADWFKIWTTNLGHDIP